MATEPADFLIITALEEERDAVLAKLAGWRKLDRDDRGAHTYYEAHITTTRADGAVYRVIVTMLSGMGPLKGAIKAGAVIERWKPEHVLMVGIAGGISGETVPGDVLVAEQVADYTLGKVRDASPREERWVTYLADANLIDSAKNFPVGWEDLVTCSRPEAGILRRTFGVIASGGDVIDSKSQIAIYRQDWPKLVGVEMEGGGVAAGLHNDITRPRFLMVRGVSDIADAENNAAMKATWRAYACDVAAAYAIGLLREGPVAQPVKRSPHSEITPPTRRSATLGLCLILGFILAILMAGSSRLTLLPKCPPSPIEDAIPPLKILLQGYVLQHSVDPGLAAQHLRDKVAGWCDEFSEKLEPPMKCSELISIGLGPPSIEVVEEGLGANPLKNRIDDAMVVARGAILGIGGKIDLKENPKTGEHNYYIADARLISNPAAVAPLPNIKPPTIRFHHPADNFWGAGAEVLLPLTMTPALLGVPPEGEDIQIFLPKTRGHLSDMYFMGTGPCGDFRSPPAQNLNRTGEPEFVALAEPKKARAPFRIPTDNVEISISMAELKPYVLSALWLRALLWTTLRPVKVWGEWRTTIPIDLGGCDAIRYAQESRSSATTNTNYIKKRPFAGWAAVFCAEMYLTALAGGICQAADQCGCASADVYPVHDYYSWAAAQTACPYCYENMAQLMYLVNNQHQIMDDLDAALQQSTGRDAARLRHLRAKYLEMNVAKQYFAQKKAKDHSSPQAIIQRDVSAVRDELRLMETADPSSTALAAFEEARLRMFLIAGVNHSAAMESLDRVLVTRPRHALSRFLKAKLLQKSDPQAALRVLEELLADLEAFRGVFSDSLHSLGPLDFVRYDLDPGLIFDDLAAIVVRNGFTDYPLEDMVLRASTRHASNAVNRLVCNFSDGFAGSPMLWLFPANFSSTGDFSPLDWERTATMKRRGRHAVLALNASVPKDLDFSDAGTGCNPAAGQHSFDTSTFITQVGVSVRKWMQDSVPADSAEIVCTPHEMW